MPRISAAERRALILDAAVELFAEEGYAGASMGAIAARAGVVPSVIYDHFPSKRDLYLTLINAHGDALLRQTANAAPAGTPREQLEAVTAAFFEFVEENRFVWRFLFRDPPTDPEIAKAHQDLYDRATAVLAALISAGAPPADEVYAAPRERVAWMVALAARAATDGLAGWWYEHPEVSREELVAVSTTLLWDGFKGMLEQLLAASAEAAGRDR